MKMRISLISLALLLGACANTSVVIPVQGPIGIRIETGEQDDCKAIIVNGEPQNGCASEI
jgi:hypothetical protein